MYNESLQTEEYKPIAVSAIHRTPDELGRGDPERDPEIKNLAANIKNQGLRQPITIAERSAEPGQFDVVIGNRRFEAWKMAYPEHPPIKCLVLPKDTTESNQRMLTVSENLLRLNYTHQDRARVIQLLVELWSGDKTSLARALGYSSAKVINDWLVPLDVPENVTQTLKGPPSLVAKRAALIAKLPLPLQKQAAEILNENAGTEFEARKIVNAIKHSPTDNPREVVERLLSQPKSTTVMVHLTEPVNIALEQASAKMHRLTKAKVAEIAVEQFLEREGFLPGPGAAEEASPST